MFFAILTFIAAFSIEAIGTVVSVIGLSTLFGANPIIMTLAVALDVGKLVVVALLYKYWGELNRLMKAYGLIAALVTMTITSAGAAGYLSGEFQKAIIGTQEGQLKVEVLKEEQSKLEARKAQIDAQIANLPSNYSRARISLMKQFEAEQKTVTDRLTQISQELPQVQMAQISTEAKAGPILYIAKAFGITVEEAVKWVILMIIFVFDPLAVFLIVAGNFLLERNRQPPKRDVWVEDSGTPDVVPRNGNPAMVDPEPSEKHGPVARTYVEEPEAVTRPPIDEEPLFEVLQPSNSIGEDLMDTSGYSDTAETKTYTRDDPIKLDATDQALNDVGYEPHKTPLTAREEITKSSLGIVRPDPGTTIADTGEIGYRTGVYRTGTQSK